MILSQKALLNAKTSINQGMQVAARASRTTEIPAKPKQMTTRCSNLYFKVLTLVIAMLPNKPPMEEKNSNPP